jgi:hypothetical protein
VLRYLRRVSLKGSDAFDSSGSSERWIIRDLHYAGLSKVNDDQEHFIRDETRKQVDAILGIDEKKPRWWIVGCPGVGKSTTLFALLNSPVFDGKGFKWVHASEDKYSVVLKTKGGDCYHGTFDAKNWEKVDEILFEDEDMDVEYSVLDGVDGKYMKTWFASLCTRSDSSFGKKKVIACTSYQAISYSSENLVMMGLFKILQVDSWKQDEYIDGFEKGVLTKLANDQEELMQKYYYAGGNMRFMWEQADVVKQIIDFKIKQVPNYESLLRNQVGSSSVSAVNTLSQSFGDNTIVLSKYVMDCLSQKVGLAFVDQASAILLDNGSWQGWVFELRMMVLLRQQRLSWSFIVMNGSTMNWDAVHPQIIDIDSSDHNLLPRNIPHGCWLKPIKYDQGCFDLLYYHCPGQIDFFQFTVSKKKHDYKLKYMAKILPGLVNASAKTNFVNLYVVIPNENRFTFRVIPSELENSDLISDFDPRWSTIPKQICPKKSLDDPGDSDPPFPPVQILYYDRQR